MNNTEHNAVVIGGGIVGLATAEALVQAGVEGVAVLEAEASVARHQTGNNSGVIHSGLYYRPGSLKAQNCVEGREAMYRFCAEESIPHDRCGKVVVAIHEQEIPALDELARRGEANGLQGLRRLTPDALREIEPHAAGVDALFVPDTGIVDFTRVCEALARRLQDRGATLKFNFPVRQVRRRDGAFELSNGSESVVASYVVNCAGLQSDRVARLFGLRPDVQIIPFRGEYYQLRPERESLVNNLIYPVPDPRFPFLGVHFTRMMKGGVEAGPNAVLALKREGYRHRDISPRDMAGYVAYSGFWRMAARYGWTGCGEMHRSLSKRAFVKALQRLLPAIRIEDVERHGAGVRAQAVTRDGKLADDFCLQEEEGMLHVLNAPSPAATASLSIGRTIADRAVQQLRG